MMNLRRRKRHLVLAAKVCTAAVVAATLTVASLSAAVQNQKARDTTETMLPDGRTLTEWALEAYGLLNTGQHTRALVESRRCSREVGNLPIVLEIQEQALSSLRAEIATQIDGRRGPDMPTAVRALRRIKLVEAAAGERPWLLQAKARANWMIGDYPAEVVALDRWLEVTKSHPQRKCVESGRSLAEAAIPQSARFFEEVGHLPSPLRDYGWTDLHYASALDLDDVVAAILVDPTRCGAETRDMGYVRVSGQTKWESSFDWRWWHSKGRIPEIPQDVERFLDTHGGTPCLNTTSCKKLLRFLNSRPGPFSDSDAIVSATALTIAVLANARKAAVKLLELGAATNPQIDMSWRHETNRNTPLHWAVVGNLSDMVKLLIEHGADVDGLGSVHPRPLLSAVEANLPEIARLLLEAGAEVDPTDDECRSPLTLAASENHFEMAKLLVDYGAGVNGPATYGCSTTPLLAAALRNHHQMARFLVDRGGSFDDGRSLLAAVEARAFDVAEFLIGRGANVGAKRNGEPLLHVLVKKNDIEGARFLLDRHADVDSTTRDSFAPTPLMVAVVEKHVDMAELLISRGANINATNGLGSAPLHWAAERGDLEMVELLVKNGADSSIRDDDGHTPSDLALAEGHIGLALNIQSRPFVTDAGG